MREWRKVDPAVRFCFSTTSSTGWKMAEREVKVRGEGEGGGDILIYNPLDFPNFVKSALRTVRPRAIVLTESEIWPNFILQAKKMGIPLFLINARVSDRSAPRYRAAKWFFGEVLSCFTKIFAQSDLDKARLVAAGAPGDKVRVTGSFKFDVARRNEAKEKELREWIRAGIGDRGSGIRMLLGGSTWPGEDEVLLKVYKNLLANQTIKQSDNQTILVIAPRHFEKADAVEANIRKYGFNCIRRSNSNTQRLKDSNTVYLADTTGELMGLYGIADVVFVGKSLCAHGSQNMIEPCLCGKPTLVGPNTENFRPVMSDLLASDAIIQVKDAKELEERVFEMFGCRDRNVAAPLGADGRGVATFLSRQESGADGRGVATFLSRQESGADGRGVATFLSRQESGADGRGVATFLSRQELGARAKAAVERRLGVVAKCVTEIRSAL